MRVCPLPSAVSPLLTIAMFATATLRLLPVRSPTSCAVVLPALFVRHAVATPPPVLVFEATDERQRKN